MVKIPRIVLSEVVFFLCDVQERFRPHIYGFSSVIKVANRMIEAAQTLNVPLVVTEQNPEKLGSTVTELDISNAAFKTRKMLFSMWTPELQAWMAQMPERRAVVLFGIESHVCVMQTAMDLLEEGYTVAVLQDGVSSRSPSDCRNALEQLRQWGVLVISSESFLFQLMHTADHAKFKAISTLVKETISYPLDL